MKATAQPYFSFDINGNPIFEDWVEESVKAAMLKWIKLKKIKPVPRFWVSPTEKINTSMFEEAEIISQQ